MKKILSIILGVTALCATGQTIEIGAGAGTGSFYFIENIDRKAQTSFNGAASLFVDVKYSFKDRIDGIKLRLQNTSVNLEGFDYQTGARLDGIVETFTTSLLYERLRSDKVFNIGYHFGMGLTHQEFIGIQHRGIPIQQDRFMSITLGGIYSLRLHEKLRLNIETAMLWTDPINTFRGANDWQTAGEDISLLGQVGVSYRF